MQVRPDNLIQGSLYIRLFRALYQLYL
jgi:hypothetical protein